MKFKVGDKVRTTVDIRDWADIPVGTPGIITGEQPISNPMFPITVELNISSRLTTVAFDEDELELIINIEGFEV